MLTERATLLDVIRNQNEEIRKFRALLAGLRTGHVAMTKAVEKVFNNGE